MTDGSADRHTDAQLCRRRMSELPCGTTRLTRGATTIEIARGSGCMDEDDRDLVGILQATGSIVADCGSAGRAPRREPLR